MKNMKKVCYFIIVIILMAIALFVGILINQNTNNVLVKQAEEVAKQATTTSSDTAYITMVDHLEEMNSFTSDATATASEIASGKTAYVNGSKLTGTGNTYTEVKTFSFHKELDASAATKTMTITVDTGISGIVMGKNAFFYTSYLLLYNGTTAGSYDCTIVPSVSGTKVTVTITGLTKGNVRYFSGTLYVLC
jgi:uncharacterized protein YxeA